MHMLTSKSPSADPQSPTWGFNPMSSYSQEPVDSYFNSSGSGGYAPSMAGQESLNHKPEGMHSKYIVFLLCLTTPPKSRHIRPFSGSIECRPCFRLLAVRFFSLGRMHTFLELERQFTHSHVVLFVVFRRNDSCSTPISVIATPA